MKGTNLAVAPAYSATPKCESRLRTHLENVFESVEFALDHERYAISNIGSDNKQAVKDLESLQKSLNSDADDLKAHGAKSRGSRRPPWRGEARR